MAPSSPLQRIRGSRRAVGPRPARDRTLRVAMRRPPGSPCRPTGYGGIEAVVESLCDELVDLGHDVTLFTCPGSHSPATVRALLSRPHPEAIGQAMFEADHVARAFDEIDGARRAGRPFDVVHDHCGFTALALAGRLDSPLVHTLHGPFTGDTTRFYAHHGHKAQIVAISR